LALPANAGRFFVLDMAANPDVPLFEPYDSPVAGEPEMTRISRRSFNLGLGVSGAASLTGAGARRATADTWPSRPVTIIMPFAAGSGTDSMARALAAEFSEKLSGRFIVENRPGAGGNLGAAAVAKAAPDGYTLLFATNGPGAVNKLTYKEMQYDPERDFAPIVLVAEIPAIIAAGPQSPAKSLAELVAYAKANPEQVSIGNPGNGTLGHIVAVLVQRQAGIKLNNIPYRGSAPLTTDLLGGQVALASDLMATYAPLIAEGRLNGIALISKARNEAIPNVPTIKEVGINIEGSGWCSLLAPTGTPVEIIEKLNTITNAYLKTDKAKAQLKVLSMTAAGSTPQELKAFIAAEIAKWRPIVQEANISL
jgi:tripartite-type tricarboxylate transporter receptor subunit TctC